MALPKPKKDLQPKDLHPVVRSAAEGTLPSWAVAGRARRAHIDRVTALMDAWAKDLGMPKAERMRWRAAGMLHDALRDAQGKKLRPMVGARFQRLPDRVLHGPAAARQLKADGVVDREVLRAVAYHTLGHPKFRMLGRCLSVADFVEPGRMRQRPWRDELTGRMPDDVDEIVREILRRRIRLLAQRGDTLSSSTVGFWNVLNDPDLK